jgi:hypothetical protein
MHVWVLCALLVSSQRHAECWRLRSPLPDCAPLMHEWLAEASKWYLHNPDVAFAPAVACTDNGPLPAGAELYHKGRNDNANSTRAAQGTAARHPGYHRGARSNPVAKRTRGARRGIQANEAGATRAVAKAPPGSK